MPNAGIRAVPCVRVGRRTIAPGRLQPFRALRLGMVPLKGAGSINLRAERRENTSIALAFIAMGVAVLQAILNKEDAARRAGETPPLRKKLETFQKYACKSYCWNLVGNPPIEY